VSHIREKVKMAVLETIQVGLGTPEQRSQAWPHGATPMAEEMMDGLDARDRQIFLWELGTLVDKIVQL
jgi:hypothetical protein